MNKIKKRVIHFVDFNSDKTACGVDVGIKKHRLNIESKMRTTGLLCLTTCKNCKSVKGEPVNFNDGLVF